MTRFPTLSVAAATALTLGALAPVLAGASVLTPAPTPVVQDAGRDCAAGPAAPSGRTLAGYRHP